MPYLDAVSPRAACNPGVQDLMQSSPDPTVVIQDGRHVFANDRALALYRAASLAELACKPAIDYMEPGQKTQAADRMRTMAEEGSSLGYVDETIVRLDGTRCDIEAAGSSINYFGRPAALVVMRDITARIAAEAAREAAEERFRSAFIHAPVGMAVLDTEGTVSEANPALTQILRCSMDELLGSSVWRWIHPDDREESRTRFARLRDSGSAVETSEVRLLRADNEAAWGYASTSVLRNRTSHPASFVLQLQDTTARRAAEDQLRSRVSFDQLTGLSNRSQFTARLVSALEAWQRGGAMPAVMFLDLDRFKVINDSMGHDCGDKLLVQVADRLRASIRPGDIVARFGGDEFAILLEGLDSFEEASRTAQRIHDLLSRPILLNGTDVFVKVSIGISLAEKGSDASMLLQDADVAMYRAKSEGGGRFATFDEKMRADCQQRMDIENGLYGALSRAELFLLYQPVIETSTAKVVGVEALIRWRRASGEVVMPDEFIPVAEETGLIVPIGIWVLQEACRQLRAWRTQRPDSPPLSMAVNVSSRQLPTDELFNVVRDLALEIQPDRLTLEITETAAALVTDAAALNLQMVRDLGVSIAIDDLGTGHSSLARLRNLPIDVLKIDRQFIEGIATSEDDRSLVIAIIAMARALGLVTVAEGVENDEQASILRRAGCPLSQGFLWGRPQPAEDIQRLLRRQVALIRPRRARSRSATRAAPTAA